METISIPSSSQTSQPAWAACRAHSCRIRPQVIPLPPEARRRVITHPCYCEEAHFYYARLHLPVAPRCNIQCNYCNRRYDCLHESRPGVTSTLLTPDAALRRVSTVLAKVPQLTVVGIAGPGDPLANPETTFRTFELIRATYPDVQLCLSTNGLALPEYLDDIAAHAVNYVTITINAVDPEIAAQMYAWVRLNGMTWLGRAAAEQLLERQMAGLRGLVERDILVKVNVVLIPGINDAHIPILAQQVKGMGALLLNVMPIIPVLGTPFQDRRRPTSAELRAIRDRCEEVIRVMRYCRQCRADAVGLLGQDHSAEFVARPILAATETVVYDPDERTRVLRLTAEAMEARRQVKTKFSSATGKVGESLLVAVATKGSGVVNEHFGHAREFLIYEVTGKTIRLLEARNVERYCGGLETCGDEAERLIRLVAMLGDCRAVLASRIGPDPNKALTKAGIEPVEAYDFIEKAIAEAVGGIT
ncbi:MAG: nitrogenase cofactor biosynthesis protein NifB, partial [Chloroflexi bacterium]|nr:nitrogenase cofactor biosynthesis protein NifB [Chloroflexota bacterium]